MADFAFSSGGSRIGAAITLIGASICLFSRLHIKKDKFDASMVGEFLATAFAFYAIFQCTLLLWAAFDPPQLNKISDLPMYLGIIALTGILISVIAISQYVKK